MKKLLLALLFSSALGFARAEETGMQVIGPFGGLNTTDNPAIIAANQAQDLLNVDITEGGRSVKKREGLNLDNTFAISTSAVHGAHKFFDSSGNEVRLWGQDNGLWASVAGAAYVRVSTGTPNATWQCTDYLGFAYCVNSERGTPVKTNGTTAGTTFQGSIPNGTCIASTPERLLVAGTLANPQRLYYSGASNFTDFTVGTLPTSSLYEDITSPGSAITHLAYIYGRWLAWKDQSLAALLGTDQTNLQLFTISNTIGTLDNEHVYDSGFTYFRGNDNHFYTYDGSVLERLSKDIGPTVTSANRRKSGSWVQSSQAEFNNGRIANNGPTLGLSTAAVSGSILPSTVTLTDTSSVDFGSGTVFSAGLDSTTVSGAITLKTYFSDGFTSLANWTTPDPDSAVFYPGTCGVSGGSANQGSAGSSCQAKTSQTIIGDFILQGSFHQDASGGAMRLGVVDSASSNRGYLINVDNSSSNPLSISLRRTPSIDDPNTQPAICSSTTVNAGDHTFALTRTAATNTLALYVNGTLSCSGIDSNYTSFNTIKFSFATNGTASTIDNVYDTARTGFFNSRVFDTAFSSPIYGPLSAGLNNNGTYSFAFRTSSASVGGYSADTSVSTGSVVASAAFKRFLVYATTMTATNGSALPQISSVTVIAASTGTFYSAVNNASSLTSWNTFNVSESLSGSSVISYFTRSSTNTFTVLSSTPTWVSQTKNATVSASTGTYFQARADFTITAATETPRLDDFTFNWFEGNASDKMYATYFDYSIWFSVSLGSTTTTNNRILKYDLRNRFWTMYDIRANGFLTYNTNLYIGDATVGKTYKFGGVYSDNSSAISSYWKSKDFFGDTPFQDEDLRNMSWYCKESSGTALSVTYQVNESTETTYSINLYDSVSNVIRHNRNFPASALANVFNIKLGDNSTNTPWECYAGQVTYIRRPWVVYP